MWHKKSKKKGHKKNNHFQSEEESSPEEVVPSEEGPESIEGSVVSEKEAEQPATDLNEEIFDGTMQEIDEFLEQEGDPVDSHEHTTIDQPSFGNFEYDLNTAELNDLQQSTQNHFLTYIQPHYQDENDPFSGSVYKQDGFEDVLVDAINDPLKISTENLVSFDQRSISNAKSTIVHLKSPTNMENGKSPTDSNYSRASKFPTVSNPSTGTNNSQGVRSPTDSNISKISQGIRSPTDSNISKISQGIRSPTDSNTSKTSPPKSASVASEKSGPPAFNDPLSILAEEHKQENFGFNSSFEYDPRDDMDDEKDALPETTNVLEGSSVLDDQLEEQGLEDEMLTSTIFNLSKFHAECVPITTEKVFYF
jgi:hypothetical protein